MDTTFWRWTEEELGSPLSGPERTFLKLRERDRAFVDSDAADKHETVIDAVRDVQDFRAATGARGALEQMPVIPDARWELLADINSKWEQSRRDQLASALREATAGSFTLSGLGATQPTQDHWVPLRIRGVAPSPYAPTAANWVEIAFDSRLSLARLVETIRKAWPALGRRGLLRRTRPMGARAIALIRFVCFENPPDATWRQRCDAWGKRHPQWAFTTVRRFEASFRRAETQLTGRRYGLEWFYEPLARLDFEELRTLRDAGHRRAEKRLDTVLEEAARLTEREAAFSPDLPEPLRVRRAEQESFFYPRLMNNLTATSSREVIAEIAEMVRTKAAAADDELRHGIAERLRPEYVERLRAVGLERTDSEIDGALNALAAEILQEKLAEME